MKQDGGLRKHWWRGGRTWRNGSGLERLDGGWSSRRSWNYHSEAAGGARSGGEAPNDDESRAAAVLDALFNDASSESDFEGFAPAEVEASMMPTVGARVDLSKDDMGENHDGKGGPAPDESDSDIDQAPADGLDADGGVRSKEYRGNGI